MKKHLSLLLILSIAVLSACSAAPAITADDLLSAQQKGYNQGLAERESALAAVAAADVTEQALRDEITALERSLTEKEAENAALKTELYNLQKELEAMQAAPTTTQAAAPTQKPSTTPGVTSQASAQTATVTPAKTPAPTSVATPVMIVVTPTPEPSVGSGNYIGNKNSKKFHRASCSSLPDEKNRVYFEARDGAINLGYDPCQRCNP